MTALKARKSKRNISPLFEQSPKKVDPDLFYDYKTRNNTTLDSYNTIFFRNNRLGYIKPHGKVSSWNRALLKGNYDTEVWAYANPYKEQRIINERDQVRTEWKPQVTGCKAVIDIDGGSLKSPTELISYLEKYSIHIPQLITQTDKNSFHLLYEFNRDSICTFQDCFLKIQDVYGLGALIVNNISISDFDMSNVDINNWYSNQYIKVDVQYLRQAPQTHKFRIPGSPKMKNGQVFVTKGWKNPNPTKIDLYDHRVKYGFYKVYGPVYREELHIGGMILDDFSIPESLTIPKEVKKLDESKEAHWEIHVPMFVEAMKGIIPKRYIIRYAKWFANNLTYLKKNECYISQTRLSQELDITQKTISKHLKDIIQSGILHTNHEFVRHKTPKVYKLGKIMFDKMYKTDEKYNIAEEYQTGQTNEQLLSDIRYLRSVGLKDDEIVDICVLKMEKKPESKRRSTREIEKTVKRWNEKCLYKRPDRYLVTPNDIYMKLMDITYDSKIIRFPN